MSSAKCFGEDGGDEKKRPIVPNKVNDQDEFGVGEMHKLEAIDPQKLDVEY